MKIVKKDSTPTLYLLSSTRPKTEEELIAIGKAYITRWNVEEYIRFLKQNFQIESFLVRDLARMKNLIKAVFMSTVVMYFLTDRTEKRGFKTHHFLLEKSLEVASQKKFRDFFFYAYSRAVSFIALSNKSLFKSNHILQNKSELNPQNSFSFFDS